MIQQRELFLPMHEIGYRKSSVDQVPIGVDQTSRFQHTYVIGQTGTGKSTFATQSFLRDVYAGHGACYFDFHGQDARWLLDHIPPQRIKDVIYIDPTNTVSAIGYNVLDGVRARDFATFTDEIVSSLRHIHRNSWGARMDDILTNAIRPLFDLPPESKGTILGAVRMLNDPFYRQWVVKQCPEKTVRDFWQVEFAGWSKSEQGGNLNSSLNKIRRFQSSPILQRILGQQKSRVQFNRAIEEGQILIFDFNKWKMGAVNANTLASLVLSRLIYEGTRRTIPYQNGEPATNLIKPFHAYIDEFHSVTSLSMVEALSGIRKFRFGFTLCHQYTNQLSSDILDAIKGNVGTKIAFRIGGDDAKELRTSLDVTEAKHLTELADYEFYVSMKSGQSVITERGYTLPSNIEQFRHSSAILSLMANKYARPVSEVDEVYNRWQNSRHYGGEVKRPTAKNKNTTDKAGEPRISSGRFKTIGQIMLN